MCNIHTRENIFNSTLTEPHALFALFFFNFPDDSSASCGYNMTLTSEEQHIYTPNYPEPYPLSTSCAWYVHVPVDSYVRFRVVGEVEKYYDYLEVFGVLFCSLRFKVF